MKNLLKNLFKPKEIIKPFVVPEYIVFNVHNFNSWFKDPNNNAVYANKGIYLRLDKLSEAHVLDYILKCYGIEAGGPFLWSKPTSQMVYDFKYKLEENWKKKIEENEAIKKLYPYNGPR